MESHVLFPQIPMPPAPVPLYSDVMEPQKSASTGEKSEFEQLFDQVDQARKTIRRHQQRIDVLLNQSDSCFVGEMGTILREVLQLVDL
jgi:hypothetical protein